MQQEGYLAGEFHNLFKRNSRIRLELQGMLWGMKSIYWGSPERENDQKSTVFALNNAIFASRLSGKVGSCVATEKVRTHFELLS